MEVRGAKNPREVDEAYELVAKIFGPNYFEAKEVKAEVRALEPLQNLADAVLVVDGEDVVGFVRLLDRQFYSPAGLVKAGGITSVCIHPDLRGQGWGRRVMEAALQRSWQRGDAFSILFARRAVDGWYPKLGYVGIGCHLELRLERPFGIDSLLSSFAGTTQIGAIEAYRDIYTAAYADSYQGLILSFYRDAEWWQNLKQRLARRINPEDFINVLVRDKPIGYFILKQGRVIEAASPGQHRADFITGLTQFFTIFDSEKLTLALPSGHWCIEFLRRMNHTLSVRYSWDGGHMIRILNKSVFKDIVLGSVGSESYQIVDELFEYYNISEHESARRLLLTIIGVLTPAQGKQASKNPVVLGTSLLPMLPTWSIVDEL